jgi:hypothetical protein
MMVVYMQICRAIARAKVPVAVDVVSVTTIHVNGRSLNCDIKIIEERSANRQNIPRGDFRGRAAEKRCLQRTWLEGVTAMWC